jgi:type III secretion system needle length determinant
MMKVDLVLMDHVDPAMTGSGAQGKGEGSGEFAAILNQAITGEVKAEPKADSPLEAVLETTGEVLPDMAEEIVNEDSEEQADQLLGDARALGMPVQQTENNGLMFANEDDVPAVSASAGDATQGQSANSGDNQKAEVFMPKIAGEIVFETKINLEAEAKAVGQIRPEAESKVAGQLIPEAEAKAAGQLIPEAEAKAVGQLIPEAEAKIAGQVNPELEAGLPKTQTETKVSSTADLAGNPAKAVQVPEMQGLAVDTVEKQGLPAGDAQLVSDDGFDKAVDREIAAVAAKPLTQDGLEVAQGQGDAEKAVNPGSGQEKAQSAVPATDSQGNLFQQPAALGDQAVRSDSILQPQQSANLRESVMQQVEGRLIYLRESGVNPAEMRLTLHPPELGEVTVRVFSKQGKLSASIIAESSLVKEILESSIAELKQRMNFVHIQFEQLDFSTAGKQSGGSDRSGEGSGFGGRASGEHDSLQFGEDGQPVLSNAPPDQINGGIDYWA